MVFGRAQLRRSEFFSNLALELAASKLSKQEQEEIGVDFQHHYFWGLDVFYSRSFTTSTRVAEGGGPRKEDDDELHERNTRIEDRAAKER